MSYYQYIMYKENKRLYYLNSHHSRLVLAVCRMVLLAGRALSSAVCVYASIWRRRGIFMIDCAGIYYLQSVDTGGSSAS